MAEEKADAETALSKAYDVPDWSDAGLSMADRIRAHPWAASVIGHPDTWSSSLRAIVSLMLDSRFPMFVAWGNDLIFLYNDAYAELLGDKHPSALGRTFGDVWREIWPDISPLVERAMAGEATWIENHHLKVHRRGFLEGAWFTFSYSPVRDEVGAVSGMFCAVTETTAQVLADVALRDLNETLEARIEERSSQLFKAETHLRQSQKFEAIGQLTGGIAHDFNNLLTVIRGSVDLLRRDNLTEQRRHRYLDAIASTADRAAKLTSQMLAFAGRQSLKPEAFDASAALAVVADMIRVVTGPRIEIDLLTPDQPCCIMADRGQFETAAINMILNGRDAMSGGGRLTLAVELRSSMPSSLPVHGAFVAMTITDTGTGIPAEMLDRIFEPFFTTKGVGSGTGLGLSQAIGFARQSGGDIIVHSVEGAGTSFTLYLPEAHPEQRQLPEVSTIDPAIDGAGRRILIVEDNADVGAFAVQALEELGFATVFARDAEEAMIELARQSGHFDLVFSDVVMPGKSGLELAHEIVRLYPGLRVVLASGYSDAIAQSGTHGFRLLRKPYSIEELSTKLSRVFS